MIKSTDDEQRTHQWKIYGFSKTDTKISLTETTETYRDPPSVRLTRRIDHRRAHVEESSKSSRM